MRPIDTPATARRSNEPRPILRARPPEAAVSTEVRIEVIESKIAHLEQALQELSDAMYRQQQCLDAQQAHYRLLVERIGATEPRAAATTTEIPPHY